MSNQTQGEQIRAAVHHVSREWRDPAVPGPADCRYGSGIGLEFRMIAWQSK